MDQFQPKRQGYMQGDDKYRSIIENMNLGLLEVDLKECILHANLAFCEMMGYTHEELMGKCASMFVPKSDNKTAGTIRKHAEKRVDGEHSVYEVELCKKDQTLIWVSISGGPLYDESGTLIGSIGIHHDFTAKKEAERKQAELISDLAFINAEFNKKQDFLKAVNDFSVITTDANSIRELVKIITDNIIGRFNFDDCVIYILDKEEGVLNQVSAYGEKTNDAGEIVNPIYVKLGEGIVGSVGLSGKAEMIGDTSLDSRYLVDDCFRFSEIAVPIFYDDEVIGVIDSEHSEKNYYNSEHLETLTTIANLMASKLKTAITWDAHVVIENGLTESESKFRNIINNSLDAVIMINSKGEVTEWSLQSEETFGYNAEEAIGKTLTELIIPDQYKEAHNNGMKHYHNTGTGPVLNQRIEITAVGANRAEFPIELSIAPVIIDGETYFSAFLRDISEQKANSAKIEKALAKEKELNEMKSKFISMTSHELRTPLTTIKSNTELIDYQLENFDELKRDKLKKSVTRIGFNVERLNQLINNILLIGKMDSNKVPFNPLMHNAIELMNKSVIPNLSDPNRIVQIAHEGDPYLIKLDQQLFIHIMNNVIENALKYSVNEKPPEVKMHYGNDYLKLEVTDYGMGIPLEDQDNLFDTFYRASNVGNIQGSGLGLSIVNEFVKIHNGFIKVKSELNIGSTFTILLPKEAL